MRSHYRTLGRTGIAVSPLCLGTMMLGAWGNPDHDDGVRLIHRALDAGINFLDTADVYSQGESERIVGKALAGGRRDHVVLATKCYQPMGPDPNQRGGSRRWITKAVDASLERLGTDWIDLYYAHRLDQSCDLDETLGALSDLVHAGKIRAIGVSSFPAHELVEAHWLALTRSRERIRCEQPEYSILVRTAEAEVLPVCQRLGMGVATWSPLGGGWLTGRYRAGAVPDALPGRAQLKRARFDLDLPHNQQKLAAVEQLARLAEEAGIGLIELALAFVLQHPAVTAPIIGPRTIEQLDAHLGAPDVVLEAAILDRIDEIVPPGTAINTGEPDWRPESLTRKELRRRPPARGETTGWTPPELREAP